MTMKEEIDEITGLSSKVIISYRDEKKQPTIVINDDEGVELSITAVTVAGVTLEGLEPVEECDGDGFQPQ